MIVHDRLYSWVHPEILQQLWFLQDRRRPTEGLQENGILDLRNHTVGVGCTFELIVFSLTSLLSHCS